MDFALSYHSNDQVYCSWSQLWLEGYGKLANLHGPPNSPFVPFFFSFCSFFVLFFFLNCFSHHSDAPQQRKDGGGGKKRKKKRGRVKNASLKTPVANSFYNLEKHADKMVEKKKAQPQKKVEMEVKSNRWTRREKSSTEEEILMPDVFMQEPTPYIIQALSPLRAPPWRRRR